MNKNDLFCQIGENFEVDWNVDEVLGKIENYISDEVAYDTKGIHQPVYNIKFPCYQKYPNGVTVSHNFFDFFPDECINVCDKLIQLQKNIDFKIESKLFDYFVNFKNFIPKKVRIMECGHYIRPHVDLREYGINIGLKNSMNAITSVSESRDHKHVEDIPYHDYRLKDGDVMILNTHQAHWVTPIDTDSKRYIISFNLKID